MESEKTGRKRRLKNKNKEVTELLEHQCLDDYLINKKREVGDGAAAEENVTETDISKNVVETQEKRRKSTLQLHIELDLVSMILFVIALCTRIYNLAEPKHIVFDELHYGRYITLYTKGVFFFDVHPPLGKQLLFLAGRLAGYDGNFTFDRIGSPYTDNVPIYALRLVPAIAGSLLVPLAYHLMLEVSASQWTAILAALLVLFENSLLAQSRFMLLECMQLAFGLAGVLCATRSTRRHGINAAAWLLCASVLLGCCFSIKYSGFYTYILAIFLIGRQIWGWLGEPHSGSGLQLSLSTIWRMLMLTIVPFLVYISVFYLHLKLLPKAGPHDSVMTSAFQASLKGGLASITHGQPLHVAHGSQITLRHTHGRTCWLHSHAHVYPVRYTDGRGSSHQQQVTCYSFKDVNNWWIVKRPDRSALAVESPPDIIRHGDQVQLLHGITSRALNSHDVAAAVSPQAQEVSCYIDYNVSMPAQNLWRVEIENRVSDDSTWDGIRSIVRLVHVPSGAALRYSGRQLPEWGFHQHEVVADKTLHQDALWNVEEHRYTKSEDRKERERELVTAEMIPTAVTQLSFWEKFAELQHKMFFHSNTAPHGHMFASEPADWPLLARSVAYWLSHTSNAQVHLIGNLVTWYAGTLSVVLYSSFLAAYALLMRRSRESQVITTWQQFTDAGAVFFFGYLLHYVPYFFMERTLFLHHYLPAYIFKILLLAYIINHAHCVLQNYVSKRAANLFVVCIAIWLIYVIRTYKKFTVLNYGNTDLTESDLINLRWKDTWDFILHKK